MEVSSQKCPCQCFRHKVIRSFRFNRSSPGTVNDQAEPEISYKKAFQYYQPSNKIWINPMPNPKEINKKKPLPDIPTQTRLYKRLDRVSRKEQDPRPLGRSSPNTAQEAIANHSPFPKQAAVTRLRSSSLQHSPQPYQRTHKPQGFTCANTTVTKHRPRHIAEPYQDPSIVNPA
ncbi:uncharacterized protein BKA55DRAFT_559456 [Fusarium redolens]|uniref:Uncharacterized protein n=1 Tax=Fusarium redolens TaxID=48865 RepID=A0A9P9KNX7_FUSRE|nr:uncharacterized protein BKA55DRAFT_559456 [Fusarium redolens]KAH7265736.1 hypothetical protein BKA55DRAFT_559456 [Fusarium redolens]